MTPASLLQVLLAGLRAAQPEERCSACGNSDDLRDVCRGHLEWLRRVAEYGQAPAR